MDTLPAIAPDNGLDVKNTAAIWRADFGDGYSQRAAKGINSVKKSAPLKWSNLTAAEALTLNTFFTAHADGSAFLYTLPNEVTARKWSCETWSSTQEAADVFTITATLTEEFDI